MSGGTEQASVIFAILLLAFFAQALKEIGIPSPGVTQSFLVYAGYQFSHGGFYLGVGIILFTFLGSISGAYLIFNLASFGGERLLAKLNRDIGIRPEAMEKARNKITTYSLFTVSVGRSVPGLMAPTSIVAGTINMPKGIFLLGVIFPLSLWILVLTTLGGSFGHFVPQIILLPYQFLFPLGILLAFSILTGILYLRKGTRQAKEG
jgi:membrane protein DedA with SNARE-associated domain